MGELEEQIKQIRNEAQAREDARTAMTPDVWEINRNPDGDDKYRLMEREWRQRHATVQLNASPKYRTVFPSDAKLAEMKKFATRGMSFHKRRLSRRPSNTKSEL